MRGGNLREMKSLQILNGILLLACALLATSASAIPFAYITNSGDNTVSVIDPSADMAIATVGVGQKPYGVAGSPDGKTVYVTNYPLVITNPGTVSVIDTAINTVIATVTVGCWPHGIAVSPDGTRVYVANQWDNTVSVIDTATHGVTRTVGVGEDPYGVAVSPDGTKVYVTRSGVDKVSVIDTAALTVLYDISVGDNPKGIAVSPDGTRLYVGNEGTEWNGNDTVSVIDTATHTVIATAYIGEGPRGVAVSPDGTRVYVANYFSDAVYVIDTATYSVIDAISVGDAPYGVSVTRDGTMVYVANSGSNNVYVIDTATHTVIYRMNTGTTPIAFGNCIGSLPPKITCIFPASGALHGGTSVFITGANFYGVTSVTFGGQPATLFTVDNATHITAIAPVHEAGPVDVVVTTPEGSVTRTQGYSYAPLAKIVTLSPSSGTFYGGTSVTITGTNFDGTSSVTFGGQPATSFVVDNASKITATTPVHVPGPVDVVVTTPGGSATRANGYTYVNSGLPVIKSISPTSGTIDGGTSVFITGSNLNWASSVTFGGQPATSFVVDSASQITAVIPAHAPGPVDVVVTTPAGSGTRTYAFTYIAPMGPSYAYISNSWDDYVSVIDVDSNAPVASVGVGDYPDGVAVNPDGTWVYVANSLSNTVSVIDTATNTVAATVPVGLNPSGVAISPDGTRAFVSNYDGNDVSIINTSTNAVIATVEVGGNPRGVAVTPDGKKVYVANQASSYVTVIDAVTHSVITTVYSGGAPYGVAISPDGTRVYVATMWANTVSVIDTGTDTVVATVPVGNYPYGVAVSPDGSRVFVANGNAVNSNPTPSVSVIDTATNAVIATIPVGSWPFGVAVTPDGTKVFVANAGSNSVSVIDIVTNSVIDSIGVGNFPSVYGNFIGNLPLPKIKFITPMYGTTLGGTTVVITGTGFSRASSVTFGGIPATSITVDSDTQITAVAPAHEASQVDVVVTTPYGSVTRKQSYTYREQPHPTPTIGSPPVGSTVEPTPTSAGGSLQADFTATITSGVAPLTVQFQDTSQGNPTGWNWDINGDGFKDYDGSTCEHTFTEPGTYTVSLSVTRDGELDSVIRADYIQALGEIPFPQIILMPIHPGWNFISFPQKLVEGHRTAGEVFSGVDTGGHAIYWYDASYQTWNQVNPLDSLDPFKGYWIYSVSSAQIPLTFYVNPPMEQTVVLHPGWNAIGFAFEYSAREGLYSVKDAWTQLIGYNSESQMYETSIVNGGSGAHSDIYPVIPGKGYWVFMNKGGTLSFSTYPLETGFPIVEESYPVYRTIIPNLTNEEIQQLGALFGVSGEVEDYIPSSGIFRITDFSRDPYAVLEFNRYSGAYRYQIPDKAMPYSTDIQPDLPSDEEARIIATEYLLERNLLPDDMHFSSVSIGSSSGDSTHVYNLTKHVGFTREIAGIPVYNTGITVTIGEGGEVVGVTNNVRQYDPVPARYMEIRTPVQAYERLRAGELIMRPLCCTSYFAVRNISLGYWIEDTVSTQEYMLPVYAFACYEPSGTEDITLFVWAVDPADV